MNIEPVKVSVIVPVYNIGSKIEKSIESIIKQSYSNMEIILVDDGSTDDSLLRCQSMSSVDKRIQVYHTENRGSGPARNFGINVASGKYLYFPDADDYIEPETIMTLVKYAENTDSDMVLCGYKDVSEGGKILSEKKYVYAEITGDEIRNNYAYYKIKAPQFGVRGAPWNKLFRKKIVDDYKVEYPALKRHQDEAFIARFLCFCNRIVFIPEVLYTYYLNDQSAEWRKYPINYIESVNGLYEDRKHNVLQWNTDDIDTYEMIQNEYICNSIKAYELSFSPKFNFDKAQRKEWIIKQIVTSEILNVQATRSLGVYQKCVLKMIKGKNYGILYATLKLKVFVFGVLKKHSQ